MEGGAFSNDKTQDHHCNEFWAPLRKRLNNQFQEDIFRIYKKSLYCDWIVKFNDRTLKINRCLVIARAYRFYSFLVALFQEGSNPSKQQIDCVNRFLLKLYYVNNIEEEENAVLKELEALESVVIVSTPESEGFITADSSPTECRNEFYDATESLEKIFTTPEDLFLEKELEEQDHLSFLFHSFKTKKAKLQIKYETNNSTQSRHVKSVRNPILKRLNINCLSDMDSGLETASSETSGMDLSDPMQSSYSLEQLSTKERRVVNEHDSSSSDTTDDFEDLAKNMKNDALLMQTKEQKQKQNEEIVIMESSSVSSETGSWESVFPRASHFAKQYSPCDNSSDVNINLLSKKNEVSTSNGHSNHYFIDASSLHDESEFCPISTSLHTSTSAPKSVNKLTKVKVNDIPDSQKYEIAEFQKEIKVYDNLSSHATHSKTDSDFCFVLTERPSTSTAVAPVLAPSHSSGYLKSNNEDTHYTDVGQFSIQKIISEQLQSQDMICKSQSEDSSSDDVSKNLVEPVFQQSQSKYLSDICDSKANNLTKEQNDTENLIEASSTKPKPEENLEPSEDQKPNFIRSNTFEFETDDDHISVLRRNNERRQGSLIFQNSIQQYSGHSLGIEESIPVTPHNSIIQLNDNIIIDPLAERPLDSLFYDKLAKPKDSFPIAEVSEIENNTSEQLDETFNLEIDLKPIKREESVPIISGGVSSKDYKQEVRMDSPLSKRKLESTPIVSGGAIMMDEPEVKSEKPQKTTVTAAWVVDMKSDDLRKLTVTESSTETKEKSPPLKEKQKTSLGFYVDLNDIISEPKQDLNSHPIESSSENGESSDKKNIFSMFIDFEAPKKSMPSRLSQSLYSKKPEKLSTSKVSDIQMSQSISNIENEKSIEIKTEVKKNGEDLSKDKSVYMFIESDTTVVKRRRSSSNNRSHNRHSWNSSGESDTSTLCHQRTYSLSGEGSLDLGPHPVIHDTEIFTKDRKLIDTSSSSDENKDTSSVTENEDQLVDLKKMEVISEVKETSSSGFVRLSDLDKPVPKIITTEAEQLPARMTRSIPETSWIENKLLMSRSTGCRTSSSRLFPHLSTSTPSNLFLTHTRSKSPGQDTDELVSELSDLSSMHSSTALEVSTEETSHSSSYQPHHATDRLGHDLLRMFLEEISPDVTVEVGGRRLRAHKCILSSRCQYFAAMLSGGWVESAGNVISLQGFSYHAVHFAMCHIYSGAADIPETISLVELATLADMLGLEGLKEVVAYTLKLKHCHVFHKPCSVCVVGVLECLPLAAAYGLDELYRKALRWITRYFVRVWPTRAFAMLPRELMEKCYQQHVVHMSADNVLETTLCCDKLLATLPSVRWAEIVHELASQLADSCQHYVTQHFSSVLASASFLSLGKELSWNISRLEDGLYRAAERLHPEQACRSYARVHRLLSLLESGDDCWSPNFVELVRKLLAKVEDCVVRQAVRVSYTSAWPRLDTALRSRIQELCCLPLDRPRISRQPRSTSGSRNLDLRQVRIAMQQHSRRAQSNDSRPSTTRPTRVPPKAVNDPPRPRTWPAQATTKTKIISSSESSRTSSPAMKRTMKKSEPKSIKEAKDDMSLDSLASPVNSKAKLAANKAKSENKISTNLLAPTAKKDKSTIRSKVEIKQKLKSTASQVKSKTTNNILKSNIQKNSSEKTVLSKSMPAMNKENRTATGKQSKSGSSSSTQHSPSAMLRNKQTNSSSSPGSQPRTSMSPYNGSPSLRRSLLLAARAPQTPVKPVSPATNKRLARVQSASHSVTSPTKSSAAKCVSSTTVKKSTPQRASINKQTPKKQTEKATVERSGTFLKDEPTVLNKTE